MSSVRNPSKKVIAIFCADLHLCMTPPPCRRGEKDWLATQAGYLDELSCLQERHDAAVICAGDIFDKWDSPVELVNMALRALPNMAAIPGQHDLPMHNLNDIRRSAYWTLVEGNRVHNIRRCETIILQEETGEYLSLRVTGFPWQCEIQSKKFNAEWPNSIALCHQYAWKVGARYPGAPPEEGSVFSLKRKLQGYDIGVFGDNHIPWEHLTGAGCKIFNCGGFTRRRSDEVDHRPSVGLLYDDGTIERHYLDISQDVFDVVQEPPAKKEDTAEMKSFLRELGRLGDGDKDEALNFRESLQRWAAENPGPTAQIILEALK